MLLRYFWHWETQQKQNSQRDKNKYKEEKHKKKKRKEKQNRKISNQIQMIWRQVKNIHTHSHFEYDSRECVFSADPLGTLTVAQSLRWPNDESFGQVWKRKWKSWVQSRRHWQLNAADAQWNFDGWLNGGRDCCMKCKELLLVPSKISETLLSAKYPIYSAECTFIAELFFFFFFFSLSCLLK